MAANFSYMRSDSDIQVHEIHMSSQNFNPHYKTENQKQREK